MGSLSTVVASWTTDQRLAIDLVNYAWDMINPKPTSLALVVRPSISSTEPNPYLNHHLFDL